MKKPNHMKHPVEFLESMKVLKGRYIESIKLGISKSDYERSIGASCLLCNPIDVEENRYSIEYDIRFNKNNNYGCNNDFFTVSCSNLGCPWIVITGMTCCKWSEKYVIYGSPLDHVYNTNDIETMKNRVRQLDRWIKIYEKYIDQHLQKK